MMRRPTAAAYCDMTGKDFEREVTAGRLPMPVCLGGEDRWDRAQLDASLERLTGSASPDWRAEQPLYSAGG